MDNLIVLSVLKDIPLFTELKLKEKVIIEVTKDLATMQTEVGQVLFRIRDKGHELFIVIRGRLSVYAPTAKDFNYQTLGGQYNENDGVSKLNKIFTFIDSTGKTINARNFKQSPKKDMKLQTEI